jgi:chemotaxis protein MotB
MSGNTPIIKKIKKVQGGGHHGGAWKVAYADFVTAMMAFFLLMWLLNATSSEQKQGLADFFDERIPLVQNSGGGDGAFNGDSMTAEQKKAESGKAAGEGVDNPADAAAEAAAQADAEGELDSAGAGDAEKEAIEAIEQAFKALSGESEVANDMLRHIRTRVTPDGLVIEVFDVAGSPLFTGPTAEPTDMLRGLMTMVANVAQLVTNGLAVTGHTGEIPEGAPEDGAWSLSSERANEARRLLAGAGVPADRFRSVSGRADAEPIAEAPDALENRRIEITLLRDNPVR